MLQSWNKLVNYLYKLNYLVIDWKGIGKHKSRIPAEMEMIFIPNFNNEKGKKNYEKPRKIYLFIINFWSNKSLKLIIKRLKIHLKV